MYTPIKLLIASRLIHLSLSTANCSCAATYDQQSQATTSFVIALAVTGSFFWKIWSLLDPRSPFALKRDRFDQMLYKPVLACKQQTRNRKWRNPCHLWLHSSQRRGGYGWIFLSSEFSRPDRMQWSQAPCSNQRVRGKGARSGFVLRPVEWM